MSNFERMRFDRHRLRNVIIMRIKRTIKYKTKSNKLLLYCSMVNLSTTYIGDIKPLDAVRRCRR